jgi:glycosyltransferase involved in cell wall biosynthesis
MTHGAAVRPRAPSLLIVATVENFLRDFLLPYARHYRAQGWRVDALAGSDETHSECAPAFDHMWDMDDWGRSPRPAALRAQLRRVREVVGSGRYDIVHMHTPIAAFVTRLALRDNGGPEGATLIYTVHGFHFLPNKVTPAGVAYLAAEKLASRWTDELITINEADRRAAERYRLIKPGHLHPMPGIGIDIAGYRADELTAADVASARGTLGLAADAHLFLMIAEFTTNKRHADAVLALAQLGRGDVHLAIAGRDGPALEPTRRLVAERGLSEQVHILGFRSDVPALIRASVATILVSAREGLPRSVMESLALGVPVIGTAIRGITDLLADGGGRLVEIGDVAGIAAAMRWMLDHPDGARAEGARGSASVAKYDLTHVIALHDRLYETCLRTRANPR